MQKWFPEHKQVAVETVHNAVVPEADIVVSVVHVMLKFILVCRSRI